jgi:hypothetical protein
MTSAGNTAHDLSFARVDSILLNFRYAKYELCFQSDRAYTFCRLVKLSQETNYDGNCPYCGQSCKGGGSCGSTGGGYVFRRLLQASLYWRTNMLLVAEAKTAAAHDYCVLLMD